MKTIVLAVCVVSFVCLTIPDDLHAQAVLQYERETRNSRLTLTIGSGYGWGETWSPGIYWRRGRSTIVAGTNFLGTNVWGITPYSTSYSIPGWYLASPTYYSSGFFSSGYTPYSTLYGYRPWYSDGLTRAERAILSVPIPSPSQPVPDRSAVGELDLLRNVAEGRALLKKGDYAKAEGYFRETIAKGKENPLAKFLFGIALLGQGECAYAAKSIRRAVEGVPELRSILFLKADDLFKDSAEVVKLINAVEKKGGDDAPLLIGLIHLLNGDREKAMASLHRSAAGDRPAARLLSGLQP